MIIQSVILAFWIGLNITAYVQQWDPYPFILLNLALSFQAAYAAPVIMMSQNRQQDIDRELAEHDYQINIKAELEIELLHQKIDQLRETEVLQLTEAVKQLAAQLGKHRILRCIAVALRSRSAEDEWTLRRCGIALDAIEMAYEVTRPLNEWMSHPTATISTTAIQNHSRMVRIIGPTDCALLARRDKRVINNELQYPPI